VRAAAPPPVFACRRALYTMIVRRARPAGQQVTAAALLCGAVFLECCFVFPRARDAWTRDDRRAHTHASSLSRLHCPTSSELWATKHAACAGALATTHTRLGRRRWCAPTAAARATLAAFLTQCR
jgi:hypothetical protein